MGQSTPESFNTKPRGLLLSAYDAGSHRYWREGIVTHLYEFQWTVLTLPARYFSWRIRGNPISFIERYPAELFAEYDFIVATSMVDLATLRGIVASLAKVPALVYFHENQFEYPQSDGQSSALEPQMVNLYTALAADRLLFNSDFNRTSFFAGCDGLMAKLPDFATKNLSKQLEQKSSVIPVPIADHLFDLPVTSSFKNKPLKLLWNHRWEYDKGPDRLLCFLRTLEKQEIPFEINIVGERFRSVPEEFNQIKHLFSRQLNVYGYLESTEAYWALLARCDVVVSTAIHEFQGVAVMEAVAAGCLPLVPDRLAYRELLAEQYRYTSDLKDSSNDASAAVDRLVTMLSQPDGHGRLRASFKRYGWSQLADLYRTQINQLLN